MGSRNASKAAAMAGGARLALYMRRAAHEPRVRDHGQVAIASGRRAYQRLRKAKSPRAALLNDRKLHREKLHRDLRRTVRATQGAASALTARPKVRVRDAGVLGGVLSAMLIVIGFALARSEKVRSKVRGERGGSECQEASANAPVSPSVVPGGAS
jgi:hypothetical protein